LIDTDTDMTRTIYFVTRHELAIGPFPSWRAATEAWQQDIEFSGDRGWAWKGRFEERPPEEAWEAA
jgi:hypothetical protein